MVVGSGAGGGVIAGKLAGAGKDVVVLEAGGYYNEADFNQLELWAYQNLYRAGGLAQTAEGQIALMTGANLGGGSTVNWTNCLRTYDWVREEWEREHGLEGLAGRRVRPPPRRGQRADRRDRRRAPTPTAPTSACSTAPRALGIDGRAITRNADPEKYDADLAGLMGFGDVTGAKLGTLKTYLQDAADAGARFVVNCRVDRVLVENGRAAGRRGHLRRRATGAPPGSSCARRRSSSPRARWTRPALLLRSGHRRPRGRRLPAPAPGDRGHRHLRRGAEGVVGRAPDRADRWSTTTSQDGYGYLVETSHASPGVTGTSVPWETGEQHKADMARGAGLLGAGLPDPRPRPRPGDDRRGGNPVHTYPFDDALDLAHFRHGLETMARMHEAAGAQEILTLHRKPPALGARRAARRSTPTPQRVHDAPLSPFEHATFSLHHMGSARMGNDPETSVADPCGELHDTPGVWIGDASAFPTASGTNPMLTTMALAHRTAEAIGAAAPS